MLTVDQCRDKLAEMEGWKKKHERWYHPVWHKLGSGQKRHPIPATLDAAAAALPDGWTWHREYTAPKYDPECGLVLTWTAFHEVHGQIYHTDTGDEIADSFNLAVLVREKIKEAK